MDKRTTTGISPEDFDYSDLPVIRRKKEGGYRGMIALIVVLMILVAAAGGLFGYGAYQVYHHDGIYDGVTAEGIDLSGMTRHQASSALEGRMREVLDSMTFCVNVDDESFQINPRDLGIQYSSDTAAAEAYRYGREGTFVERLKDVLRAKMSGYKIPFSYSYDLDSFDRIAKEIAEKVYVPATRTTYEVKDDAVVVTVGNSERTINPLDISKAIASKFQDYVYGDLNFSTEGGERDTIDLSPLKLQIDKAAKDAYLDVVTNPDSPVIVPEETGIELDLSLADQILAGEGTGPNSNVYTIPLTVVEPEVKREDIVYFTYDDLLSTAKTTLNANNINRTSNIKLACEIIDGTILYPGDEFSFNKVVGERTYEAGFKDAAIYLAGEIADGVGGGICQVSSTLYQTAVGADLEITQRKNHRYTVTYTELGEDATVAYGAVDFRFRNNTDYAIQIRIVQESNYVLCEFYGTLTDENRNKTVTMEHTVNSYSEFKTVYQISDTVSPGHTSVKNGGYSGYNVTVYRVIKQNGVEVSRTQENTSVYTKLDRVVLINEADARILDDGTVVYAPGAGSTSTPDPEPDPGTTPEPDPGTTPTPDPGTTPTPDPGTTPEPDPGTTPEPDPGTTPEPDPGTTPEPDPGDGGDDDLPDWLR